MIFDHRDTRRTPKTEEGRGGGVRVGEERSMGEKEGGGVVPDSGEGGEGKDVRVVVTSHQPMYRERISHVIEYEIGPNQ